MRTEEEGEIGSCKVTIEIEGKDEQLVGLIYADMIGQLDEMKQIVEHDINPELTEPPMMARWSETEYAETSDE